MTEFCFGPIFAAGGDLIEILFILAVIIFSVLGSLIKAFKSSLAKPAKKPPALGQGGRHAGASPMEVELEKFLRQATGQESPPHASARQNMDTDVAEPAMDIEIVEESIADTPVGGLEQHHLDSSKFSEQPSRLGRHITGADEEIASHLHETFDHKLGELNQRESTPASEYQDPREPAHSDANTKHDISTEQLTAAIRGIGGILQNKDDLRRAIILNEVLTRPDHRW